MKTRLMRTVAAAALLLLGGFGECQNNETLSLVGHGYTLLSPPSNLFAPGAVVLMSTDEHGSAQLRLLCGPRASLGAHWSPRISETMSSSYKMSRTQKITLEAEAVDRFKTRTSVEEISSVSVQLSNPRLIEAPEESVYDNINERSLACSQAIESRQSAGYHPTFVTSAYAADVEYTVHFRNEASLTKRAKEDKMARIAAKLGGGHTEVRQSSFKAVNLILALKADEFVLQIQPEGRNAKQPNDPLRRLNTPMAEALPGSEVPLVPPAGGWASPIIGG